MAKVENQNRVALWSCGGGRQSAGVAALLLEGKLPKPDHACMVAIEWELGTTWKYVNSYIRPALEKLAIPFTLIPRQQYATVEMWSGKDDTDTVLPMYTTQSGKTSKLNEWCSGEWKRAVAMRWAAQQADWKVRGVDNWIGISFDERRRRRAPLRQWIKPVYPLLDLYPQTVSQCLEAVHRVGWPEPPRSRCRHCPNQSDAEWLELSPEDLEAVCVLEEELQQIDPHVWFHKSCQPLRTVQFDKAASHPSGGCSSGMCF